LAEKFALPKADIYFAHADISALPTPYHIHRSRLCENEEARRAVQIFAEILARFERSEAGGS